MEVGKDIHQRENNPGASRYGNFINYYTFHPAKNRIDVFPKTIWQSPEDGKYVCLDIGCNTGEMTAGLLSFLQENTKSETRCHILGIDLDSTLIERATEMNKTPDFIEYKCMDIMEVDESILLSYLQKFQRKKFDITFCMSITMWIHLNHGDAGLEKFLRFVCEISEMIVLEPQPRKCYREAVRRLSRAMKVVYFKELKNRMHVVPFIEKILESCEFVKIAESPYTSWKRQVLFYKRKN